MSNIFKLSSSNRVARKQEVLTLETIRENQVNFWLKMFESTWSENTEQPLTTYQICSESFNL